MKIMISGIMVCLVVSLSCAYAADNDVAKEQANYRWSMDTKLKGGMAKYEEKEQGIKSDYRNIYSELLFQGIYKTDSAVEFGLGSSFGYAPVDTETWYVNNVKYQTNDLDFYRFNLNANVGVSLPRESTSKFHFTPYVGYGFRFIKFERTDFNVFNIITSTDVVNEQYYIHHADLGVRFNIDISEKFSISASGLCGYVFYNQADNSSLGAITGDGGLVGQADIELGYFLTDNCQLILGGFADYQKLEGGSKNNVIWPDNKLTIYGGSLGARIKF